MDSFSPQESLTAASFSVKHASWFKCVGVGVVALVATAGCADRNKDNIPESPATSGEINKTLDKAGDVATNTAATVEDVAANAATTGKIKSAIIANDTLKAAKINVDTKNNIVYLRGTVASAAQSKLAVSIAKQNAPKHSINNLLTVAGNTPATKAGNTKAPAAKTKGG